MKNINSNPKQWKPYTNTNVVPEIVSKSNVTVSSSSSSSSSTVKVLKSANGKENKPALLYENSYRKHPVCYHLATRSVPTSPRSDTRFDGLDGYDFYSSPHSPESKLLASSNEKVEDSDRDSDDASDQSPLPTNLALSPNSYSNQQELPGQEEILDLLLQIQKQQQEQEQQQQLDKNETMNFLNGIANELTKLVGFMDNERSNTEPTSTGSQQLLREQLDKEQIAKSKVNETMNLRINDLYMEQRVIALENTIITLRDQQYTRERQYRQERQSWLNFDLREGIKDKAHICHLDDMYAQHRCDMESTRNLNRMAVRQVQNNMAIERGYALRHYNEIRYVMF